MRVMLTYVIAGLATGSVYALAGMGLALTYKTSGVFNFAYGAVGAVGAYVFWELRTNSLDMAWPVALILAILSAGVVLGLVIGKIAGPVSRASSEMKIVAMVGLLLVIEGLLTVRYGHLTRFSESFLPTRSLPFVGVRVGLDQFLLMLTAALSAIGLYAFFRLTRSGKQMRAVVDDNELLALTGTSPERVHRSSWLIGSSFAVLSGILLAPQLGLQPSLLTLLVVAAFGGAAIGRFESLPLVYLGGLIVGVSAAIFTRYTSEFPVLHGVPDSMPFIVLFVALLGMRQRTPAGGNEGSSNWSSTVVHAPRQVRLAGLVLAMLMLATVPMFIDTRLALFTSAVIYVIIFLSLGFLVRVSGQVSLCHIGFAAVGAAAFSHFAGAVPWMLAFIGSGIVTMLVGAAVGIPAIRLSGLYLALATFGFGVLLQRLLYSTGFMFGATGSLTAPRPGVGWLASDTGFYYLCLAMALLVAISILTVQHSRLGRLSRAMADAPVALISAGTSVNLLRVLAFCISAFLAGLAGALLGMLAGSVNGNSFQPFLSLTLLAVLAIQGVGTVRPALFAALAFAVAPSYIASWTGSPEVSDWLPVLFGLAALGVAIASTTPSAHSPSRWRVAVDRTAWRMHSPVAERSALGRGEGVASI